MISSRGSTTYGHMKKILSYHKGENENETSVLQERLEIFEDAFENPESADSLFDRQRNLIRV